MNNKEEAERKFKQLTEAYEVLSDKKKRQDYDMYGEAGANGMPGGAGPSTSGFQSGNPADFQEFFNFGGPQGGGFTFKSTGFGGGSHGGFDFGSGSGGFGDIFSNLFGGMGGGNMGGFQQQQHRAQPSESSRRSKPKGNHQQQYSDSSTMDALSIKLEVTLEDLYKGRLKKMKVSDDMINPKTGRKSKFEKVFPVTIEAGAKSGSVISFDADNEFPRSVKFELVELPHSQFTRKASDIIWKCSLSIRQIEKGVTISIPLLDGKSMMIETKDYKIRSSGTTSVPFEGYGLPVSGSHGKKRGQLIVQFSVKSSKI